MYDSLNRIVNKECESKAQCEAHDTYDIEALGILISIMSGQFIRTLEIDPLLPDKEEVNQQERCQRSIYASADRKEASEVFCDLAPYAEQSNINARIT